MALQNVTLALPGDLLREARHLAVNQGVSLSRFLALVPEERVARARRERAARERVQRRLREGLHLGVGERIPWTRDALHERRARGVLRYPLSRRRMAAAVQHRPPRVVW